MKIPGVIRNMSHYEKDDWRRRNVLFIGDTIGTYAETVGDSGDKMYNLLRPRLDSPKQFVGFDSDRRCIYLHRGTHQPWYCSYTVDAFGACNQLARMNKAERLDAGLTEHPLRTCNFDVTANVGNETWWKEEGAQLPSIVDCMLAHSPTASVILNHTLDRNKEDKHTPIPVHVALIRHTERLCQLFKDWEGASPDIILGRQNKLEETLKRTGRSTQYISKYEIYVGDRSKLRMATLRIRFSVVKNRRTMTLWPSNMLKATG